MTKFEKDLNCLKKQIEEIKILIWELTGIWLK